MKERKTKVGKFLQGLTGTVGPVLLQAAGELSGIDALKGLANKITRSPELDIEHQQKAIELIKEDMAHFERLAEIEYKDRDSARKLQSSALEQEDKFSKRFIYYLASFWSAVAAAFIFIVIFVDVPEANTRIVDTILGFLLGTIVAGIITYFFGSSLGSKQKTESLKEAIKGV